MTGLRASNRWQVSGNSGACGLWNQELESQWGTVGGRQLLRQACLSSLGQVTVTLGFTFLLCEMEQDQLHLTVLFQGPRVCPETFWFTV